MRAAALALLLSLTAGAVAAQQCDEEAVYLRGDWGQARFAVEIADDPAEQAQGLMHREHLASSAGMLFIYDKPQTLSFWMRNTLIPLDIIFIDPTGTVQHIHHSAQPLDETPIPGGSGLTHVLEINGGLATAMGITEGSQLRHPSFAPDAAQWQC
ncbi:DUF192 domain-containing protein [uncultured Roseobacter sp.]|uniref:DUF192 domain-containing protein n=1 Tax=uncultured Roseobacter sp. TaxID=114847 RepID=UPI00260C2EFF|nr:DUF192 domain-containing protein [uncultured Roseobacter sp.]